MNQAEPRSTVTLRTCVLDLERGVVETRDGPRIRLTTRERALLRCLVEAAPDPVSRDRLLVEVWGYADQVLSRACDNAVHRLRVKIEADPTAPDHLLTVHGTGYQLVLDGAASVSLRAVPDDPPAPIVVLGDVRVDLARMRLHNSDGEVALTATEARLLARLLRADGAVVDRGTLLRDVWDARGTESGARGRRIDTAIRRLRTKIEADPSEPRHLLTAVGGGYKLLSRSASGRPLASLPAARDRFVGRDRELAWFAEALGAERVLSVQGPGGIGKSRLALEAVRRSAWSGGAWQVDLDDVSTAAGLAAAVSRGLELPGPPDLLVAARSLAARGPAALLLDGVDRVAAELPAAIGPLLDRAPQLVIVVTSRVRPALTGSAELVLGSLIPTDGAELLTVRAGRRIHSAERDRLVAELDGIPLAIELAAASVRVRASGRVGERFQVLTGGGPDRPARHASLAASLEASLRLLDPAHRRALARLVVFAGDFDLEAADAVLGDDADLLQTLCDHSWVGLDPATDRFGLLPTLREFAAGLGSTEDRLDAEVRHGEHYACLGSAAALDRLDRRDGDQERAALRADWPNLLVAGHRAVDRGDRNVATACGVAAARGSERFSGSEQALDLLERIGPGGPRESERLLATSRVLGARFRVDEARETLRQALAAAIGPRDRGRALRLVGVSEWQGGDRVAGRAKVEEALRLADEARDPVGRFHALSNLASMEEDHARQVELQLAALDSLPAAELAGTIYNNLCGDYRILVRGAEARDAGARARSLALASGAPMLAARAAMNLGWVEMRHGTAADIEAALAIADAAADDLGRPDLRVGAAMLRVAHATDQGRYDDADREAGRAAEAADRPEVLVFHGALDLAELHRQRGRWDEAGSWLRRRPPTPLVEAVLARLAFDRDPSPSTLGAFEAAVAAFGGAYPSARMFTDLAIARGRWSLGDRAGAEAVVRAAERDRRVRTLPRLAAGMAVLAGEIALAAGDRPGAERALAGADAHAAGLGDDPTSELERSRRALRSRMG